MARLRPTVVGLCVRNPPIDLPADAPALAPARERLALVFTELMTNALRHAEQPVSAELHSSEDAWLVLVVDASPKVLPRLRSIVSTAAGGRGLPLIEALTNSAGWHASTGGKTVWAEIADLWPEPATRTALPAVLPEWRGGRGSSG